MISMFYVSGPMRLTVRHVTAPSLALAMCMSFRSVLHGQSPCSHFTLNLLAVPLSSKRAVPISPT